MQPASFAASLEKFDDTDDLAVLKPDGVKIDPSRAVDIGDPSKLTVGQMLYAMGHPRNYDQPLSRGRLKTRYICQGGTRDHRSLR